MDKLNGFEVFDDFMPGSLTFNKNIPGEDDKIDNDALSEGLTDEELEKIRNKNNKDNKVEDDDDPDHVDEDDDDGDDDTVKDKKPGKKTDNNTVDVDDNDGDDDAISSFFEVLSEKMGWSIEDDEEIPRTPEELVEYFQEVIQENSVPQYASEEIEALDNFVKNGGNLRDYLQIDADIDLEEIDITEDEGNQKLILKEFLKEKGFNSKQIEKKISKYEDAGLLEDEAEDALEALKEIRAEKKQQLLKEQEKAAAKRKEDQQKYFTSVVNEIKGLDNIRGIKIPEKEKKALLEYIFKPDQDGLTKFNKDWSKSVRNLIETAYFVKNGDALIKAAKTEGSNSAINRFKNSLNRTGISRKTKIQDNTSTESMWDSFARQLRVN